MQQLLAAVRRACSPTIWSRGVQLSRSGLVLGHTRHADEIEVRVDSQRAGHTAYTVSLYPDDADWSCDCAMAAAAEAACAHVAAAVIALAQGQGQSQAAPAVSTLSHLVYVFKRLPGGLALQRCVAVPGQPLQPLTKDLRAASTAWPSLALNPTDKLLDNLLRAVPQGILSSRLSFAVLQALLEAPHVLLDKQPVAVGEPRSVWRACITRRTAGAHVQLRSDTQVLENFANGVLRSTRGLHAVAALPFSEAVLRELQHGKLLRAAEVAPFVTQILPALQRCMPCDVEAHALPQLKRMPVRLHFDTGPAAAGQAGFAVLPTLVYQSEATQQICARVDLGHLHYLQGDLPLRNAAAEAVLSAQVADWGLKVGQRSFVYGAEALALAAKLPQPAEDVTPLQVTHDFVAAFRPGHSLVPRLAMQDDVLQLDFQLPEEAGQPTAVHRAEATQVLQAWQAGEPMVRLLDGSWAALPQDWLAQHGAAVLELLAARNAQGHLPRAILPSAATLLEACGAAVPAPLAALQRALQQLQQPNNVAVPRSLPASITAVLRDYQRQGIVWLCALADLGLGALLADDMGLGKTLQALGAVPAAAAGPTTLIIAPTSVLFNWQHELARFRAALRVHCYHGAKRQWRDDVDVVLTSFSLLRLEQAQLTQHAWQLVIIDEAQNIKNPRSQVSQAACQLVAHSRIALSGTPVENRLEELWSIFQFLNPGLLGSLSSFQSRFAAPIAAAPNAASLPALQQLQQRLQPFMLRRKKSDVAVELPARSEFVLPCELTAHERQVYETVYAASVPSVLRTLATGGQVLGALEVLLRLRQACCHPSLVPGMHAAAGASSAKLTLLCETLQTVLAAGHRALVFSQWTSLLDLLEPLLRHATIDFCRLDGATRDRQAVVQAFQAATPQTPQVMLLSLKAGGTGLNLTAADHVFLLDPWWNPAVEDQAADRAHRIGQTRPVFIHRMIAVNTVEERILQLSQAKRRVGDATLEGFAQAQGLSSADLSRLLQPA